MPNILETSRLLLRELVASDAGLILELMNEPGWLRHIGNKSVHDLASARDYILKGPVDTYQRLGFGLYLTSLADATPIGICGLIRREGLADVDLGFALLARYEGQGYAREAAAAMLAYGHERLGLKRIVAITNADNSGSIRVLESIGMHAAGRVQLANESLLLYAHEQNEAG